MNEQEFKVRDARPGEFGKIGQLMVQTYSQLEGFPKESEQPDYYELLANDRTMKMLLFPRRHKGSCLITTSNLNIMR